MRSAPVSSGLYYTSDSYSVMNSTTDSIQYSKSFTCTALASVCVALEVEGMFFKSCVVILRGLGDGSDSTCGMYVTTPSNILEMVTSTLRVRTAKWNTITYLCQISYELRKWEQNHHLPYYLSCKHLTTNWNWLLATLKMITPTTLLCI
jgi:hypothetical protein